MMANEIIEDDDESFFDTLPVISAGNDNESNNNVGHTNPTTNATEKNCKFSELPSPTFIVEGGPAVLLNECQPDKNVDDNSTLEESLPTSNLPEAAGWSASVDSKVSLTTNEAGGLNVSISQQQRGFNIEMLKYHLNSCVNTKSGEIDLESYLNAYLEICKLLDNFGNMIRTYIGKDIKTKIALMRKLKAGSNGAFYQTIDKMVTYEKITKFYQKHPDENGSKTILSLHRSLLFVAEFLRSLNKIGTDQPLCNIGKEVYNRTLSEYHPWAYTSIAKLAFNAIGKKGQLVANFHDGSMSNSQLEIAIGNVVEAATLVHSRCEAIYEKNNFLSIQ